jgi:hypothetical protein
VEANPHLARLIDMRSVAIDTDVESNIGQSPRAGVNESEHAPSIIATGITNGAENPGIRDGAASNASLSKDHETETGQENTAAESPHSRDERSKPHHSRAELSATKHPILDGALRPGESFDFCMCNPPFFESMDEASANPRTACGGTEAEMVFPGGEEAFVGRMIEDSCRLKGRVHWYTSMVGKKASLKKLTALLRQKRVKHLLFVSVFYSVPPPLLHKCIRQKASVKRRCCTRNGEEILGLPLYPDTSLLPWFASKMGRRRA